MIVAVARRLLLTTAGFLSTAHYFRFQRIEPDINGEIGVGRLPFNANHAARLFEVFHISRQTKIEDET